MPKPNLIDVRSTARNRAIVAGSGRAYARGDVGRENAEDPTTAHLVEAGLLVIVNTDGPAAAEPDGGLIPPAGNAPTSDWAAYASLLDVDVADDATRTEIRGAIADAGHPTT